MAYLTAQVSQLVPAPILGTCVWGMITLLSWSIWAALREGITRLTRLHQIPCDRCMYCTGDYRLKCAVHPCTAFTEDAIDCRDFEPIHHLAPLASCTHGCHTHGCHRQVIREIQDKLPIP